MVNRVILIVLDSLGIGELPDAQSFGDAGADTFGHIVDRCPTIQITNLLRLGFGNIDGAAGGRLAVPAPEGSFCRCAETSTGKDTITGHWEIAGIYTPVPFKTYPDGFPRELMDRFEAAIGTETLGNYAASGTVIIEELGPEHEATGKPIVYTSADSVFQIAANTDVIPLERLYQICETAREMLQGEYACGRVIARPYVFRNGKRERTADRRDYAVSPPEPTLLDQLEQSGADVCAIGKISDIFNGSGITRAIHTESNLDGIRKTIAETANAGGKRPSLIFTNLVDFDSKFGHRRDPEGYAHAIEEFDENLPELRSLMTPEDLLILCADHGNDPVHSGWDHTREYVPVVFFGKDILAGKNLGTRRTFGDIGATIAEFLGVAPAALGESMKTLLTTR
jgi:phosphopentomutase